MGNDGTELVNRVNDEVRKRQKRMSNVAGEGEEHSIILGMFMAVTMNAATFMGNNFQNNQNSIVNTSDLTLKKMLDISAKLVSEHVREHRTKRNGSTFHRPCTTHHNTPTSTARAGALMLHHLAWVEHHTGGSRSTPTVPPVLTSVRRPWVAQPRPRAHASDTRRETRSADSKCADHPNMIVKQGW